TEMARLPPLAALTMVALASCGAAGATNTPAPATTTTVATTTAVATTTTVATTPAPVTTTAPVTALPPTTVAAAPAPTVTHVVDGDTVVVSTGQKVRIIGIDTPEAGQCGYEEAATALAALVDGHAVTVTPGARDDADKYGR